MYIIPLPENLLSSRDKAVLLGCKKLVVKSHGSSKAESIYQSILLAYNMDKANLCKVIEDEISKVDLEINE